MAAQKHESKYKLEDKWGELTNCEDPQHSGGKASSRPKVYCKPVTALDTLTVEGAFTSSSSATLNQTEVLPPMIKVGGLTFVPMQIQVVVGMTPGGAAIGDGGGEAPAAPQPIFGTYTVLASIDG